MATWTGLVPLQMLGELVAHQLVLQATHESFRLLQLKAYILDPITRALNRLDGDAEW